MFRIFIHLLQVAAATYYQHWRCIKAQDALCTVLYSISITVTINMGVHYKILLVWLPCAMKTYKKPSLCLHSGTFLFKDAVTLDGESVYLHNSIYWKYGTVTTNTAVLWPNDLRLLIYLFDNMFRPLQLGHHQVYKMFHTCSSFTTTVL
jgi:hypothetical protein